MDATSGTGTTYTSAAPELTSGFLLLFFLFNIVVFFYLYIQYRHFNSFTQQDKVRMTRSLVLCVVFGRSLFVLNLLVIMLSILRRFTDSDYPFGFFKLFLYLLWEIWNNICWYLFEFWIKIYLKENQFDTNILWEKSRDQRVIIWCKSKKDRQNNGQKKTRMEQMYKTFDRKLKIEQQERGEYCTLEG